MFSLSALILVQLTYFFDYGVVATLRDRQDRVHAITYNREGTLLAASFGSLASEKNAIFIWDCNTWKVKNKLSPLKHLALKMVFSPDSRHLAVCTDSDGAFYYEISTGEVGGYLYGSELQLKDIAISKDGKKYVGTNYHGMIYKWNAINYKLQGAYENKFNDMVAVVSIPTSKTTYLLSKDSTIRRISDIDTHEHIYTGIEGEATDFAISSDGKAAAIAIKSKILHIGNPEKYQFDKVIDCKNSISTIVMSPDDLTLAVCTGSKYDDSSYVKLVNMNNHKIIASFKDGTSGVSAFAYSPSGAMFAYGGMDGVVWVRKNRLYKR